MIAGNCAIRAGEGVIRVRQDFWCCLIFQLTLKHKDIKINLDLKEPIQETIY